MLAKITKGREFYGCLSYVLSKSGAEMLASNMAGETASELAIEFRLSQQQHQRQALTRKTQKVVCHVSLSVEIGKNLSAETWNAIAKDYLDAMGFDQNQYVLARHTDTEHDHVHLVVSRLRIDGTTVSDWLDYRRTETILRTLEEKYQLRSLSPSWESTVKPPTVAEIRQFRRTQQPSVRTILQVAIDEAADDNPTFETFCDRLKNLGVSFRLRHTPNGIRGISYKFHSIVFPGYKLGKRYTWQGLQTYFGVQYESTHAPTSQENPTRIDSTTGAGEHDLINAFTISHEPTRTARTIGIPNQSFTEQTQTSSSAGQSRRKANTRSTTPVTNRGISSESASSTRGSESRVEKSAATFRGRDNSNEHLLKDSGGHSNLDCEANQEVAGNQRQLATTHPASEYSDGNTTAAVGYDRENSQPASSTRSDQTQSDADLRASGTLQPLDSLHGDSDDSIRATSDQFANDLSPSSSQPNTSKVATNDNDAASLWQFYCQDIPTKNPVEKDLFVAWRAFQDGYNRREVSDMLQQSPYVRWVRAVQGESKAQDYIHLTIRAANKVKQKSSKKQKSQHRKVKQSIL